MDKINEFRGEYYFLSNFYEREITYDGLTYKNSEAAFQAQKCKSKEDRKRFCNLNASEAKKLGRKVSLRPDWDRLKVQIMKDIVTAKFKQNADLQNKLICTGNAYLEEGNTWGDRVWGCVNGRGANLLGQILMEIRTCLQEKEREVLQEDNTNALEILETT